MIGRVRHVRSLVCAAVLVAVVASCAAPSVHTSLVRAASGPPALGATGQMAGGPAV